MWERYEEYKEYICIENHPHFCPRKNGDSCRPVFGFYRLKRELHTHIVIPISSLGLLRLFPCSLWVLFLSFLHSSCGVRSLFSSCGCRFPRFPVPVSDCFLAVSAPLGCRFPLFPRFPRSFPSLSWRAVWLCVIAFRPFSSRLPSRYSGRGAWRRLFRWADVCPVAWCCVGWLGVLSFRLAARFSAVRGAGRFSWFFHVEIIGGGVVRGARRICCVGW